MVIDDSTPAVRCVVLDLNSQYDFCNANGAFPVCNHEQLIPAMRRVIAWVKRNGVPVVSSVDSHRAAEMPSRTVQRYAVDGSLGQRKLDFTVLPRSVKVQVDNTLAVPLDLFSVHQQVIFRQRGEDLLGNPKADRFLTQLRADEIIICGNTLEGAVKNVALGLITRDKQVTVVADACGYWDPAAADLALRLFEAKSVRLITVDELLSTKLAARRYYRLRSADQHIPRRDPSRPADVRVRSNRPRTKALGELSPIKPKARISRRRGR